MDACLYVGKTFLHQLIAANIQSRHCLDNYPGTFSWIEVSATHLNIGHLLI